MYLPKRRHVARRQMQVSQAGRGGSPPPILLRFRDIVAAGNVTRPYRGNLYYWKTTRVDAIDVVAAKLWPYLSETKRSQFTAMTVAAGRVLPRSLAVPPRGASAELAWAAGLFDGEGSIWASGTRDFPGRSVAMELAQASASGVPETLRRFHEAVRLGRIMGPHRPRSPWSRLPQYRWAASGRRQTSAVVGLLWPWLGIVKRERVLDLLAWLDPGVIGVADR